MKPIRLTYWEEERKGNDRKFSFQETGLEDDSNRQAVIL
jgi:hypothetical protein